MPLLPDSAKNGKPSDVEQTKSYELERRIQRVEEENDELRQEIATIRHVLAQLQRRSLN